MLNRVAYSFKWIYKKAGDRKTQWEIHHENGRIWWWTCKCGVASKNGRKFVKSLWTHKLQKFSYGLILSHTRKFEKQISMMLFVATHGMLHQVILWMNMFNFWNTHGRKSWSRYNRIHRIWKKHRSNTNHTVSKSFRIGAKKNG